jgi:hypothetical protein
MSAFTASVATMRAWEDQQQRRKLEEQAAHPKGSPGRKRR